MGLGDQTQGIRLTWQEFFPTELPASLAPSFTWLGVLYLGPQNGKANASATGPSLQSRLFLFACLFIWPGTPRESLFYLCKRESHTFPCVS